MPVNSSRHPARFNPSQATRWLCWLLLSLLLMQPWRAASGDPSLLVADQSYNTLSVMEAAGVLKDVPYTIAWKQFAGGFLVAEALNAGSVDVGFLGDAPPLFLGTLGAPIKVIAVTPEGKDGVVILVAKESPIHSLTELRGARVAIWKGSWTQQLLFTALERAGVAKEALQLRYLNILDSVHALSSGAVDAIITWDPYTAQLERQGARPLITAQGLIPAQSFVVATDQALRDKRAQLHDFLQRLQRARRWSLSNDQHLNAYASLWAKHAGSDASIASIWFKRSHTGLEPISPTTISEAQRTLDFFAALGLIKNHPARPLFDDSLSSALQAEPTSTAP